MFACGNSFYVCLRPFFFRHFPPARSTASSLAVYLPVQSLDRKARFTPISASSGPSVGPECTFLILVDSDWSLPLKEVDSGLTLLLV